MFLGRGETAAQLQRVVAYECDAYARSAFCSLRDTAAAKMREAEREKYLKEELESGEWLPMHRRLRDLCQPAGPLRNFAVQP